MKQGVICIFTLLLTITLWLPKPTSAEEQQALATIDGQQITSNDFQNYLELFDNDPRFRPDTAEARKKLLEHLIDRTILLQYAKEHDYFKLEELQKHRSLNQREKETIILRRLLTDKISNQVHCSKEEIKTYQKTNPKLSPKLAKEQLTSQKQQELFKAFMGQLKKEHVIIVYQKNLEHF
ncbi:MAG: SurA N-terminal domain-containing protein [Pseudomonadota bacterium]|nr:SurA N-terminal domain-containing protein [Pseudomonadota bacterium]